MSEYFDPYANNAEKRNEPKKTNYLFWGCLGCSVVAAIVLLLIGIGVYVYFDKVKSLAELGQGAVAQEEGDLEKAVRHYDRAIELSDDIAEVYILRADALRQLGRYEEAIRDCEKAIALRPKNANAYNIRGIVHDAMGDSKKALADFLKALELGDDDPIIYSNIALTYNDLEDYDNALKYIQQAIKKNPKELFLIYYRGLIRQNMKNYTNAIADYQVCMNFAKPISCGDLTVEQTEIEESYVSCLTDMEQYDKVNAYWKSKIAKEPANLDHYHSYTVNGHKLLFYFF